jgi:2-C-methyl-D-erythritol 4-phosphate cytidylyltransferase
MVEWSIDAFRAAGSVGSIVVAAPPGHVHGLSGHDLRVVDGGKSRAESVANALEAVGTELVAVHDAARPLVTAELIESVIGTLLAAPEAVGAIAATTLADTIKQTAGSPPRGSLTTPGVAKEPQVIESTLDRGRLWAAQTPQVFRVEALRAALAVEPDRRAVATDEAMLVEVAGGRVLIHPSPPQNLKVTTPLDLRVAEMLLTERAPA